MHSGQATNGNGRGAPLTPTVDHARASPSADALRRTEPLYRTLIESLPQHVFFKDTHSKFVSVNAAFAKDFGKQPHEFIGKSDFDLFPGHLAEKYYADDQRVMAQRTPETLEEANIVNGRRRFVEVTKAPVIDGEGEVIGLLGIFTDVTERRLAQEELFHERNLMQTLLENIPDRIYFKDTESRFVWCSPSLVKKLGATAPGDLIGKTDFDFHPEDRAREFFNEEQRIMQTRQALLSKIEKQTAADGSEIWAAVSKVPVMGKNGCVAGLIGISRDITDLKRAEEEARRTQTFVNSVIEHLPIMIFIKRA